MNPDELLAAEALLDAKFYGNWEVNAYLSPSEPVKSKPILPTTDRTTNRMGHARNWPGPDTPLVEARFWSLDGNDHSGVYTNVEDAIDWLLAQDPHTGMVNL